jgi:hypothetical protein
LPRSTRQIGAMIEKEFGIAYQGRSGLIALLHRMGMEHRKPQAIPRKLDEAKQQAFIEAYNGLLNGLSDDEAVMFADAVHPTHAVRPVGCWAPKETKVAVEQASGRDRLNIHGAIDLETGRPGDTPAKPQSAKPMPRLTFSFHHLAYPRPEVRTQAPGPFLRIRDQRSSTPPPVPSSAVRPLYRLLLIQASLIQAPPDAPVRK